MLVNRPVAVSDTEGVILSEVSLTSGIEGSGSSRLFTLRLRSG